MFESFYFGRKTESEREWRSKVAKELTRNQVKFNSRATTCSLNLVLSLSKEWKAFRVCGGRQSFCSVIIPYVFAIKTPLGTQIFHLS